MSCWSLGTSQVIASAQALGLRPATKDWNLLGQDLLIRNICYETSIFISFLDYWQVTLTWSPYGDDSLIHSLLIGDTSTTYYTDVAIRVTMTLY